MSVPVRGTSPSQGLPSRDGRLGILNGEPVYEPPTGTGAYPVLEPGDGLRVYVNDRLVAAPTVVFPQDRIRFELPSKPPVLRVSVEVSPDGLLATLQIERIPGASFRVADVAPSPCLRPRAVPRAEVPPPAASWDMVQAELSRLGVCYGLDEQAALRALEQANQDPQGGTFRAIVALGDEPRPPRNAMLRLLENLEPGSLVVPGQPLARKLPAAPGRSGRSVRNETLPVPEPHDPPLVAGPGAQLSPDGTTVVAARGGRLCVRAFTVWVQSVHEVAGDVTAALSPVRFPGDIVVQGQCLPGSELVAGGQLQVRGSVDSSRLQALHGISVGGGVFRSTLLAGPVEEAELAPLAALLQRISSELARMSELVRVAAERTRLSESDLAPRVLEMRGGELRRAVGELRQLPKQELLPEGLPERLVAAATGLSAVREASRSRWEALKEQVDAALEDLDVARASEASITAPYAHNSTLKASGSIRLLGRGSYHSQLQAGSRIEVLQGSLVGGQAVALSGDIVCHTLGGERSVTHVVVSQDSCVRARVVVPDVVVQVGGRRLVVTQSQHSVAYKLEDERVVAVPWNWRRGES